MFPIPPVAEPLVRAICPVFTRPTFQRFILLMSGLIVTMGRHTVSRALAAMQPRVQGHWCNYHRIYSAARFSMWKLAAAVVREVVILLPGDQPIILVVDDTVDQKTGDRVWAQGAHRDARRSTRSRTSIKFGHKWLVMGVLVQLPGMDRPWALPILCGLCRTKKIAAKTGQRAKTPSQLSGQMLIRMMRWFPTRKFILLGDSRAVSHQVACFAHRHRDRVTLISRLRADANLYDPPRHPARQTRGGGRARKGRKQPSPCNRLAELPHQTEQVQWYGSSQRQISHVSDTGLWYNKHSVQVVPIRWVCVLGNPRQNLENAYFYSSDPAMPARRIIEMYARRWNIEVTFEECRALLGLETTRHWCRQSVLRVVPILFGLFTAVSLIWKELFQQMHGDDQQRLSQTPCYRKRSMTFADALYLVRQELWTKSLLGHRDSRRCLNSLPQSVRTMLLWHLAAAA